MKKIAIIFLGLFFICCKSSNIKNETNIIETYVNQVLLNKPSSLTKQYYEHGIRIKAIKDKKWFVEYTSRSPLNPKKFYPKISDSLFDILFNQKSIEFFNNQLLNKFLDSNEINHLDSQIKIRSYSDEINEKHKYYRLPVINISKPLLSTDQNYAIIFFTDSHEAYLHLFKKGENEWKYFSTYNLIFP